MSPRNLLSLTFALALLAQVGCCGMNCMQCGNCCDVSCGVPGCGVADPCCGCPSCGVADTCCDCPTCGVADPCCGCPEPACGCDVSCGVPNCGSMVCGRADCPILRRLKSFFCGDCCSSCGGCACEPSYGGEYYSSPSCPTCQQSSYEEPMVIRPHTARLARGVNVADEIRFASGSTGQRR